MHLLIQMLKGCYLEEEKTSTTDRSLSYQIHYSRPLTGVGHSVRFSSQHDRKTQFL